MQADAEGLSPTVMEKMSAVGEVTFITTPFNATGHPAMGVPCGFGSPEDQLDVELPIGMQLFVGDGRTRRSSRPRLFSKRAQKVASLTVGRPEARRCVCWREDDEE